MRLYEIYLIRQHVANDYFGKDDKLFQLFIETKTVRDAHLIQILNKQIKYVTRHIVATAVYQCIEKNVRMTQHKKMYRTWKNLRIVDDKGSINLRCFSDQLIIEATGSLNQEAWMFEALRTLDDYFLAIDCQNCMSGWLKPPKTVSLVRARAEG